MHSLFGSSHLLMELLLMGLPTDLTEYPSSATDITCPPNIVTGPLLLVEKY